MKIVSKKIACSPKQNAFFKEIQRILTEQRFTVETSGSFSCIGGHCQGCHYVFSHMYM